MANSDDGFIQVTYQKKRINLLGLLEKKIKSSSKFCYIFYPYSMNKFLFLNIREMVNSPSLRRLKKLVKTHKVPIFVILEPKVTSEDISSYQQRLNCHGSVSNPQKNYMALLEVLWYMSSSFILLSTYHSQCISNWWLYCDVNLCLC